MFEFPNLLECNNIPNVRSEIPTLDIESKISLLIGRDLLEAHHILDQ